MLNFQPMNRTLATFWTRLADIETALRSVLPLLPFAAQKPEGRINLSWDGLRIVTIGCGPPIPTAEELHAAIDQLERTMTTVLITVMKMAVVPAAPAPAGSAPAPTVRGLKDPTDEAEIMMLVKGFDSGTLKRGEVWDHRAHLIVACYLRFMTHDEDKMIERFKGQIEKLGAFNNLNMVYNVTITRAYFELLREFLAANGPYISLVTFTNAVLQSALSTPRLLEQYYSPERLYTEGHTGFVMPDRKPLDWRLATEVAA